MKNIDHPYGNIKISTTKLTKKLLLYFLKFIVNIFFKLDKNDEIIISSAVHAPWLEDKAFYKFYTSIKDLTLLDPPRAYTLWQSSKNLKLSRGNILDIGCLLGGAGFLMNKANQNGATYLFDTFSGFKKDDGIHKKKIFYFDDISSVKKNIKKLKLNKITVHKSHFPKNLKLKINKIKLCHIDVNTYESTKEVFEYVDKKLIKGGVIIFDDFGIWGVNGIKKYIYEIHPNLEQKYYFMFNYMGQCILTKKY
jgi:O-methyltransferase